VLSIGLLIILFSIFKGSYNEQFYTFERKPASNKKIQIGVIKDTPGPMKGILKQLQTVGMQLREDTEYDTVAKGYLDPNTIK